MNIPLRIIGLLAGLAAPAMAQTPLAQLRVATVPDGAIVTCDGILYDAAPITIPNLAPGEHLVVVQKAGYNEARRTVTISNASRKAGVELRLEPLLGLVLVQTSPAGADISIDGADRGKSPLLLSDLPVARHRLTVNAPGFAPKNIELSVDNRTPQLITLDLASDSAKVSFNSSPAGASVTVNGLSKGTTPCDVDQLPAGENTISLVLPGYAPFQQKVKLQAGTSQRIEAALTPLPVSLSLISTPPGARLFIDDKLMGQAPLTLDHFVPGTYAIRAELPGYETETRSVELKAQDRRIEEFQLVKKLGTLEVLTDQPGTRVVVDGEEKGALQAVQGRVSEPFRVDLPIGSHSLELSKRGYVTIQRTIRIEKGATASVRLQMIRNFVPDTMIRLQSKDVLTGCLSRKLPNGDIELETKLGIYRTVKAEEIASVEPIIEGKP